jgi:hypothetical protein
MIFKRKFQITKKETYKQENAINCKFKLSIVLYNEQVQNEITIILFQLLLQYICYE